MDPIVRVPTLPGVPFRIPPQLEGLRRLAYNLWWSWNSTGASLWLAQQYLLPHLESPWMLIIVLSLFTIVMTELVSNSAVVAIVVPIGMSISKQFGMDPKVVVYAVASASGRARWL